MEYELLNAQGQRCGVWWATAEVLRYRELMLPPGAHYSDVVDLSRQARVSPPGAVPASPDSSSPLWQGGHYTFSAVYRGVYRKPEFGGPLRSNTVTIEVLAPDAAPEADRQAYASLAPGRAQDGSIWIFLGKRGLRARQVLDEFPSSSYAPWCRLFLAEALQAERTYDAAATAFGSLVRDLPATRQAVVAQWDLGMTLREAGRHAEAAAALRALEEDPSVPEGLRQHAAFYRARAEQGR